MERDPLISSLEDALAAAPQGALLVGFSGGLDSTVLLHALAALPQARARGLRALHVDHGLQAMSRDWGAQCVAFGESLGVPVASVRVELRDVAGHGVEGAAREARHAAFAAHLQAGEVLALAHHRDDQAETVLLRLLHGAGAEGLAGMRGVREFGSGWLWRPLLAVGREAILAYARRRGLRWIEDPSNASLQHARNHVRHVALPALAARWPDATRRIAAAAERLRGESEALDAVARDALDAAQRAHAFAPAGTLDIGTLRTLRPALLRLVLGRWLDARGLPRPPPGIWAQLPTLLSARADASPLLAWRGAQLRRHRGDLFALRPAPPPDTAWSLLWDGAAPLVLPQGFGKLALARAVDGDAPAALPPLALRVGPRQGGERLAQPGAQRELRTLLQDLGVPPWVRERVPLLFDESGALVAAGDLALAPAFAARLAARGVALRWQRAVD